MLTAWLPANCLLLGWDDHKKIYRISKFLKKSLKIRVLFESKNFCTEVYWVMSGYI